MSFLRGSTNYVWCTTSVLGKGATGAVYQGVNKHNGEAVAVKTFNQLSHMRPLDVQLREFEVLRRVNHENIVKLLAIEDDQEGRGKVIVMELCTGGSLFNILDDPENAYGLPESEFMLVLEHLCAGMKHLRDNNLVHRDLKPGNIMKFISEEGKTIYKLTDFGAARELQDNQQFVSLYGTEEYLHPNMYERAVLRKSVTRSFTANVDLWSIGVTLYHVATGNLPFRPFGGRKNKEMMHLITTKKASGVISGVQLVENGPITWSRTLPAHCQLSEGLKQYVTPFLAGLLEESQDKMWSFERFFTEVTNVLSKKVVYIFHMNRVSTIEVLMKNHETINDLKNYIQMQTEVTPQNQLLVIDSAKVESTMGVETTVQHCLKTSVEKPIVLFTIDNNNVNLQAEQEQPKFPTFSNNVSVESDATIAKLACSVGYCCKRRAEEFTNIDRLIKYGTGQLIAMLRKKLENLLANVQSVENQLEREMFIVSLCKFLNGNLKLPVETSTDISKVAEELETMKKCITGLSEPIRQHHNRFVVDDDLTRQWQSATHQIKSPSEEMLHGKMKYLVERLRESWQHLLRDRATRSLTYNDEQFHALEKIKMTETGKRIKSLLNTEIKPSVLMFIDCLADWYKISQTIYLQTEILENDLADQEELLQKVRSKLFILNEDMKSHGRVVGDIDHDNGSARKSTMKAGSVDNNTFSRRDLKTLFNMSCDNKTLVRENADLMSQLIGLIDAKGLI